MSQQLSLDLVLVQAQPLQVLQAVEGGRADVVDLGPIL
jgi:hypothetical protein